MQFCLSSYHPADNSALGWLATIWNTTDLNMSILPHQRHSDSRGSTSCSIGGIPIECNARVLHIDIHSKPASTVCDERGNLICFFAKQTIDRKVAMQRLGRMLPRQPARSGATRQTRAMIRSAPSSDTATLPDNSFYYFFSPLYFGESPCACIGPPEVRSGRTTYSVYTFKRRYDEQSAAERTGYFGERVYPHGYLTKNERTNGYEYYRCPTEQHEEETSHLSSSPFLLGTVQDAHWLQRLHLHNVPKDTSCGGDGRCLCNIEFHRPGNVAGSYLSADGHLMSLKVSPGSDVIENICLWCACSIFLGCRICISG